MATAIGGYLQYLCLPTLDFTAQEIRNLFPSVRRLSIHAGILTNLSDRDHEDESNADSCLWLQEYEGWLFHHSRGGLVAEDRRIRDMWLDPQRTFAFEHRVRIRSDGEKPAHLVSRLKGAPETPRLICTNRLHTYEEITTPSSSMVGPGWRRRGLIE